MSADRKNRIVLAALLLCLFFPVIPGNARGAAVCLRGTVTETAAWPESPRTDSRFRYLVTVNCTDGQWRGEKVFFVSPTLGLKSYERAVIAKVRKQTVEVRVQSLNSYSILENISIR